MVDVAAEVANVDLPFLLGLDFMTRIKMVIYFDRDKVRYKAGGWNTIIVRKLGNVYVVWSVQIFYTHRALRHMHRYFYHPSAEKLFKSYYTRIQQNRGQAYGRDLKLCRIRAMCINVRWMRRGRFESRYRERRACSMRACRSTYCSLDGKSVLNAVEKDTKLSAACFLT